MVHAPRTLLSATGQQMPLDALRGQSVAAFCGIGNPAGFRHTLAACGCRIAGFREFPDHHRYTPADRGSLAAWAERLGALAVLCTRKDLVKLSVDSLGGRPLWAVGIELEFLAGPGSAGGTAVRAIGELNCYWPSAATRSILRWLLSRGEYRGSFSGLPKLANSHLPEQRSRHGCLPTDSRCWSRNCTPASFWWAMSCSIATCSATWSGSAPRPRFPILRIGKQEHRLGGAGSVASMVATLGAETILAAVVGDDAEGRLVRELLEKSRASTRGAC